MSTPLVKNIATVFGAGYLKGAPGTWGSLVALVPGYFILENMGAVAFYYAIALSFVIGVWASGEHEKRDRWRSCQDGPTQRHGCFW